MTRLQALDNKTVGSEGFGLTNYDKLQTDIGYLTIAGADLASTATINPTAEFHKVTGTTTIDNIVDSAGAVPGQQVRLWFTAALTVRDTGGGTGNIRTIASSDRAVKANEVITFTYDGALWRESGAAPGQLDHLAGNPVDDTTYLWTANAAVLVPFTLQKPGSISEINVGFNVQSGNIDVGIYPYAGGAKIFTKGSTACPATGVAAVAITTQVLPAGEYWLAFAADNGTVRLVGASSSGAMRAQRQVAASFPLPASITPGSTKPSTALMLTAEVT